eukprot:jgi/Mesvir1/19225/Mv11530-RA.1
MPKGRKATGGQAARGEDGTPTPRAAAASHAPVAFSAKKKQLATLLAKCISPAEAVGAVEQVFGAEDWVTDASSWSSSQLKSVVQLLADHYNSFKWPAGAAVQFFPVSALPSVLVGKFLGAPSLRGTKN